MLQATDQALAARIAFLQRPESYPEPTTQVHIIETHMSLVFLTDGYAYKLKKPVRYPPLDFTTLDRREFYCREELRLNRALARPVYLDVVALAADHEGHLSLNGPGDAVDWLVRMRRLPADRMLDRLIASAQADPRDMARIAARLVAFYRLCAPVIMEPAAYRERLRQEIASNEDQLRMRSAYLSREQIRCICSAQHAFLQDRQALFDERVAGGHIVEGHGDLRPEHVCVQREIWIIDRLEFDRGLRIVDTADETAFLALECERFGAPALGTAFLKACAGLSGDFPPASLIHFYQSLKACIRANIAIRHLDEAQFRDAAEWPRRAQAYLDLAEQHTHAMVRKRSA
ncbi:hypothetical protein JJB74_23440 [Noviherbaspirillum sp. DKR-6]|uniref:Aminoglycoside phosphotransferase domain-containing protein n=1 Tax=Noviherbaspirillum pedocola TaxID=2801341 RepID=A0A934SXP8_9BURK|nr:hypothetical protein [Noviherbaspirillum pedocola]